MKTFTGNLITATKEIAYQVFKTIVYGAVILTGGFIALFVILALIVG